MKTMESSSWNKKWQLKEGNIVNDNKELSLNPTTKNNLNDDLEFAESPTQENPQNLIRYRRSNGDNNQPPSIFVPVDVPGDGSCLFWATALAYLIPVEDNSVAFAERFKRLFGEEESGNIGHIRELIREYGPLSNNVRSDRIFNRLITRILRNRVVDYISSDADRYREFITGDFNQYLNNIRDRNSWGGEPEIEAMGRMLGATINVDADGVVHTRGNGNIPIRLYHVNAARSASQGNEGNHYNFGLESNLHQQVTNEVVPELVDHLFQIDENNNFKQRFQSFLDQIPRPSGVGAAPAKKGFYVNFFAGMFTTLKNTELFDRLGLAELHFKLCTISDADEVPFLKIVAITEEPTTKKLEEYVFVISEKRYSRQIMGAIFSRDDRRWLEESRLLFSEGDDTYHLRSRAHTKADDIEFKSGAAIIISKRNNKDRVNVRAEQLTDQELPERMRVKFRRIEQHRKHKIGEYKSNLLEDIVKNLSKETINDPRRDIDIVQAVQSNVKKLFEYIYDINGIYHKRLPNIQGALEAADHGFTAGALINFKYRYNLELYLELLLGIEGYIDIALLVRGSQRVKKAMPILVEIKTGQEQNGRTNPQQALREAESYTQGLQQNNRPFVTLADRVVRVGFNMDYANPIETSVAELQPPAPIIRSIFKSVNSILRGQERRDDIKTSITNQLKKIYKLSPAIQGSSEPQYLSRLFIGHSILNSVETRGKRIDKHILTYRKLQDTTRGTRRSHDITTSVFIERIIAGSNTGDSRVLVIHFHEGGRGDVDINDPTLRVPLNGIINQANCKEVIEVYVDARSGNDGSLKFLGEDNGVVIQDFTNSVNDYFQANVVNHWEIHNMPDFNQAGNLKKTLDATVSYQPQRGQNNKVDLGPYGDMFTNIGKNLFSVKSLITSEAYFAAVLSGLLNSYSDIEFDQGDFKINVRPEFQVGGGERIDLFINVMSKNPADSDVLIGLELKYGDGRATVDSMDRALEKAEKVQLRRYGISRNIRAITEGANFFVTLPVGFVSRAEAPDSLVITREQFVAYDIERSFLGQVHQLGRSVQRNEQTLESVTLQQNPDYRYWLSDQDIRRIAHLDNTYSNMFDVHAMNNNYDTSGRGVVVVTDRDQGINTGELREQIRQFIDNVDNNRIVQQQGVPRRTFIVNQGGDHWTTLVISQQNGQYHGYYVDSLGSGIPDNIRQILQQTQIADNNIHDIQISQQADGYNCGLWVLENARDINTMLQENRDVQWLRAQLAPERLSRNSEQYFIDKRKGFSQVLHDNQPNGDSSQSSDTDSPPTKKRKLDLQCLHGSRSKRSVNDCLYSWEDVDEFNAAEQEDRRNRDKIKIDSEKFLNHIRNTEDNDKRVQLVQFADEIIHSASDGEEKVVGRFQNLVNKLINNHKVTDHLDKVGRISGMTMYGMMGKHALADFFQGDYKGVAINIGFIAGGQGLAKVSEIVSMKGLKLVSGGKLILGRSLGAASPFLARGTSAFVVYDLVNQVKELKAGNKDALVGVIGDSVYLTIDVAEVGVELAEVFGALEGLSSVTGPVGAAVGAVVFVGTDIYFAVKKVDKIDQVIHLTRWEKFKEGWRAFLGMNPEGYLEEVIEEKEANNRLVRQKIEFLKQHPDIQRYVFPTNEVIINCKEVIDTEWDCNDPWGGVGTAMQSCRPIEVPHEKCTTKIQEYLDNTVLLDEKRTNIKWIRAKPDNPSGGKIFCYPEGYYEQVPSGSAYKCKNAIGITDSVVKSGNYTLIDLGKGHDKVIGFPDSPNIFLIDDGRKNISGGNKNDVFILHGNSTVGYINGGKGDNVIDLSDFATREKALLVMLSITSYLYTWNDDHDLSLVEALILENNLSLDEALILENINSIVGRKNKRDIIYSDSCDTKYINSRGGSSYDEEDTIIIESLSGCFHNIQLQLEYNTQVNNYALQGNFSYIITAGNGVTNIITNGTNLRNNFFFNYTLFEVQNVTNTNNNITISFLNWYRNDSSLKVNIYPNSNNNFYRLSDNTEMKLSGKNLYAIQNTNKSVDKIIQEYPAIAHRLEMFMVVRSSVSNETVSIGHGNHEVISNDAFHKSHLVGGKGEDIYVITSGYGKLNSTDELRIPETTIYSFNGSNQTDIIDLRQLSQQIERYLGDELLLESVRKDGRDVLIELFIPGNDLQDMKYVTAIRLKDAFESKWYEKLQVILNSVPMKINYSEDKLSLIPEPIVFGNDTQIIVITERDIDRNTELVIPKKIGQYSFFYIEDNSHNFENDLVVTNVFDSNIGKENWYTILLSNFYEKPDKMQTLYVKFVDKRIALKDELEKINNATEFLDQLGQYESDIYSSIFDQMDSQIVNITPGTAESHHHGEGSNYRHSRAISEGDETIAQSMSSSASRLEFWPVNLVKSMWSTAIDAVNYLSSNSSEKRAQSLSNTNDTTRLGSSFEPYPSNMGNNTKSQQNNITTHHHRHLRAINVADEYVASSSAITLSLPINSRVNWFKEAGIVLINVVKPINRWYSVENDNTEDKVKINGSASLVENKAVKDINANMPFWWTSNVYKVKEQIVTQHQQYGPTTLDIGDQLVNQTNKNGILQLLDLFIRKWTGQKLPRWRVDVSDSAVEVVVQAESIIDEFMQQIKESAMSCGIQPTVKKIINSCDLQVVKAKIQQKLNAGQIEDIPQILYDKIVQANIGRIELYSTPKQSKKLSQDMLGKLSKIKQLLLNKEVELPITQKAIFGHCTRNRFNGYIGRRSHNNLLSAKLNKDQHVKQNNSMNINNDGNDQDSDSIISTIKNNDLKMLKAYLEAGKDANTFSRGGMTLLMRAVSNNCSTDLVKLLIEYGADVNTEDKDRETAINIASYNGNLELIKVLISEGAIIKNKTARNSPFNSVAESSMPQNIKNKIIKLLSNNLSSVDSSNNKLNKDNYVISNLVEQMSAMNSSNGNVGFSTAESTNVVPPYLGQNPNCYNEVKVFA
ncbi:ankyrin repeat domain-containing protein [Rickettsia endosymbiont of Polydrusus tereticollis]|uniref:ankyrin repeat domain-containing protein n=1 Tax=Rickettsia endosymbiont of Polydrusus tereticollis TaxID=3066251 RepID=UPI0031333A05